MAEAPDPSETSYREPSNIEERALDPSNPYRIPERVRITVPNGQVDKGHVTILADSPIEMMNVLRTVVSLEPTSMRGKGSKFSKPGTAVAFITKFNNETGLLEHYWAECIFG